MDTPSKYATRTESEMNLGWARENPALFVKTFAEYQEARPANEWDHKIDLSRTGYVTLRADRKPEIAANPATGEGPSIMVLVNVGWQRLADMIVGAFEGGSNYWLRAADYVEPGPHDKTAFESPIYSDPQYWRSGGRMKLTYDNPAQGPDRASKSIGLVEMISGLQKMSEKYPHHFHDLINENDDATTSDCYIQCVLFGEMIYE